MLGARFRDTGVYKTVMSVPSWDLLLEEFKVQALAGDLNADTLLLTLRGKGPQRAAWLRGD